MYGALKAAMFRMDPERAHRLAMVLLRRAHASGALRRLLAAPRPDPRLATRIWGIDFAHPIGLAAGFDKEAEAYNALFALGFGHVELGTVTPEPQPGNPKPRVHRVPEQDALVNAMGFPGPGWAAVCRHLAARPPLGPVGLNIGPNKDAPRDQSVARLAEMAAEAPADYVALNVSSPNTPGLRDLQEPKALAGLVGTLREAMDQRPGRPLLVKLHPDAPDAELRKVARAAIDAGAEGLIAVNTTRQRPPGIPDHPGGLSGQPLRRRALEAVRALSPLDVPVIGVGGVATGADAYAMMQAGASLVQLYTGFIYRGPRAPWHIQQELLQAMDDASVDRL